MVRFKRFDVCLVNLDSTVGSEIKKTRPCVIVSPDEINFSKFRTVIVAPMTSMIRGCIPTRIDMKFKAKNGQVALDQIRAIDRVRIIKSLGAVSVETSKMILQTFQDLFAD